jgi:hypothetical protein
MAAATETVTAAALLNEADLDVLGRLAILSFARPLGCH